MARTTKFSLSASLRTSFFLILLHCAGHSTAQSSGRENVVQKSMAENFSSASIAAYRENSLTKVEDFYQYLNVLADSEASADLKKQVAENIYSLFTNKHVFVTDITAETAEKITLEALLTKISQSKNLKFELQKQVADNRINWNYWGNSYAVAVISVDKTFQKQINQRIYLIQKEKDFGGNNKAVWSMLLGEMN